MSSTVRPASRLRTIGFPVSQRLDPLELATYRGSPASDSRLNLRHCSAGAGLSSRSSLKPASALSRRRATSRQVSGSFHTAHAVLFDFPSEYWYAIGPWTCLDLGGQRSRVRPEIPVRSTRFTVRRRVFGYGAVTLFGCLFQGTSPARVAALTTAPHLPFLSEGIRLGLCPFRSPLLRVSLLLSFPAPTIMLYFRAFPSRVPSSVPLPSSALAGFGRERGKAGLPGRRG